MENFRIYAVYGASLSPKELNDVKSKMPNQSITVAHDLFAEMLVKCLKNSDFISSDYGLFVYVLSSKEDFDVMSQYYDEPKEAYKYDSQFNQELKSYCMAIDLIDQIKKSLLDLYEKTGSYSDTYFNDIVYNKSFSRSNLDFIRDEIDEEFGRIMLSFEQIASQNSIV